MPARKSFLEATDVFEPWEISWKEDSPYDQRKINNRSTIRSQRSATTFSSSPGGSRTVTKVRFTQSRGGLGLGRDVDPDRVLKAKPSMTFGIGSQSTGMLTLLGQHFPELLSDGAFKRELERGRSREPQGTLRYRKSSGLHSDMQDIRSDDEQLIGRRRHREYYRFSWKSTNSGRRQDPSTSVISLKQTSPAGIESIEASVRSTILRPEHERLDREHPAILLDTAKPEPSLAFEGVLPLVCNDGAGIGRTLSAGDDSIFEENSNYPTNTSGIPYQSYVEDDTDKESA